MLSWLLCRLAPHIPLLSDATAPALPEPSPEDRLEARTSATFAELAQVPFEPRGVTNPYRLLMGIGCRDLVTREADQHPDTAGRTSTYDPFPAFQPVEIPVGDGLVLCGHHSTGAPGAPVVIVAHGLFDSHTSSYVVEHAEVLRRWGFHVVALDLRDHGRLLGRGPASSLGWMEGRDLLAAARVLSEAEGVSVGLLGMSYGGHCVVRAAYEASISDQAHVLRGGVMAVSPPLNVLEAVLSLDDPSRLPRPGGFLDRLVLKGLLHVTNRHLRLRVRERGGVPAPEELYERYVRDIVLPAYPDGPRLVGAYLGAIRSAQPVVMGALRVPTALLHPVDDPFVPVTHTREALAAAGGNPFVWARELPAGGHVGLGGVDPAGTLALLGTFFGRLRDG